MDNIPNQIWSKHGTPSLHEKHPPHGRWILNPSKIGIWRPHLEFQFLISIYSNSKTWWYPKNSSKISTCHVFISYPHLYRTTVGSFQINWSKLLCEISYDIWVVDQNKCSGLEFPSMKHIPMIKKRRKIRICDHVVDPFNSTRTFDHWYHMIHIVSRRFPFQVSLSKLRCKSCKEFNGRSSSHSPWKYGFPHHCHY